jgi:hypothetical protein
MSMILLWRSPAVMTPLALLLDLDHLGPRLVEDLALACRDHHVVDAERDAGLRGVEEGDSLSSSSISPSARCRA